MRLRAGSCSVHGLKAWGQRYRRKYSQVEAHRAKPRLSVELPPLYDIRDNV
jgi:hypothetical protein